jgi:hypothetical protein
MALALWTDVSSILNCPHPRRFFGSRSKYRWYRFLSGSFHRKDRTNKTGGGVLLAIKNEYNSEHVPELDTDCEIVWAKMNLKGNGTIYTNSCVNW